MCLVQGYNILKNKYEGAGGQFASESSRIIPSSNSASISDTIIGEKRKMPDGGYATNTHKTPLGMWDAFGDDIAKYGYNDTKDVFMDSQAPNISSNLSSSTMKM